MIQNKQLSESQTKQLSNMTRVLRSQRAGLQGENSLGINVPYEMGHWVHAHSCKPGWVEGPARPSLYPSVEGRITASQRHPHPNS